MHSNELLLGCPKRYLQPPRAKKQKKRKRKIECQGNKIPSQVIGDLIQSKNTLFCDRLQGKTTPGTCARKDRYMKSYIFSHYIQLGIHTFNIITTTLLIN